MSWGASSSSSSPSLSILLLFAFGSLILLVVERKLARRTEAMTLPPIKYPYLGIFSFCVTDLWREEDNVKRGLGENFIEKLDRKKYFDFLGKNNNIFHDVIIPCFPRSISP
jgi:hypothetical protein